MQLSLLSILLSPHTYIALMLKTSFKHLQGPSRKTISASLTLGVGDHLPEGSPLRARDGEAAKIRLSLVRAQPGGQILQPPPYPAPGNRDTVQTRTLV